MEEAEAAHEAEGGVEDQHGAEDGEEGVETCWVFCLFWRGAGGGRGGGGDAGRRDRREERGGHGL